MKRAKKIELMVKMIIIKCRKYLNKVFFFYQLINVRIQDKIYMRIKIRRNR